MNSVIYEPRGRAKEYSPLALNLFEGCHHGCKYCYVSAIARQSLAQFQADPQPRKDILERLRVDAPKFKGDPRQILLCFTSDPYQTTAAAHITQQALDILDLNRCNPTVLTKGGSRAKVSFDLLGNGGYHFGTTLCFMSEKMRLEWEPNASTIADRAATIREAHDQGIFTWVSIEPVIEPKQALSVVSAMHPYVDFWKIGKLNHFSEIEQKIDWTKFLEDVKSVLKSNGAKFYIKNDLAQYEKD